MIKCAVATLLLCSSLTLLADSELAGHAKYQGLLVDYPEDSLLHTLVGDQSFDQSSDVRLKFKQHEGNWSFNVDYQLVARYGETVEAARSLPVLPGFSSGLSNDDARLFDLSWEITDQGKTQAVHRLDRLHASYSNDENVIRVGRQAVSWGNGLIYTPMDFLNPFDPAAVDKEYKTGDDMLYGQHLMANGDDLQLLIVGRRNPVNDEVESAVMSSAIKYHGFIGERELDLLLAQHFDDLVVGVGAISNVNEAVWRGDITFTETDEDGVFSAVTSLSYSWVSWGKNVSGVLEFYYNGFGENGNYGAKLADNPALVERLQRGELFTLGRHYIAASAMIEVTPLLHLTPNVFINLDDPSALGQLVLQYDLRQNWLLLTALNVPIGPAGSEFGGIDTSVGDTYLSTNWSVFAQLSWYF